MHTVVVINSNIIKVLRRAQSSFCESGRDKVHDDRGNTLSVGKGISKSTIISMVFTAGC